MPGGRWVGDRFVPGGEAPPHEEQAQNKASARREKPAQASPHSGESGAGTPAPAAPVSAEDARWRGVDRALIATAKAERAQGWTAARDAALAALWRAGFTDAEIQREIGAASRHAVIGRRHRTGLGGRRTRIARPVWAKTANARKAARCKPAVRSTARDPDAPALEAAPCDSALARPAAIVSLNDLKPSGCRFPFGDPKADDFGFCGAPRKDQSFYCASHHAAAHAAKSALSPQQRAFLERAHSGAKPARRFGATPPAGRGSAW